MTIRQPTEGEMRRYPAYSIAVVMAVMLGGLPAVTVADDAIKAQPAKTEPGKVAQAKEDVKQGARAAGREVKETAKTAGHEVKQAAKETEAGAKKGWHEVKHTAAESWRSVKSFFSRLWNG